MAPRAYISDFTIHFNQATVKGVLYPIRKTEETKFSYCTPKGDRVSQVYLDSDGKRWYQNELKKYDKSKVTDGEPIKDILDPSAISEAKESDLIPNTLTLTAHPRDDVDRFVFPDKTQAYIIKPVIKKGRKEFIDPVNTQWYDFLNIVVRESNSALIGLCNLKGNEGLFRLGIYQGFLTLQKQTYPEQLNQYDRYYPNLDEAVKDKAVQVSDKVIEAFDAADYVNKVAERLAKVSSEQPEDKAEERDDSPKEINMLEALDMFGS